MIPIFMLILILAIPLPEITRAEDNEIESEKVPPMMMVKSTLKYWHSTYNYYREEINLGYCWADYFLDVKKFLSTLTGPRLLGIKSDDPSPLIAVLKGWFNNGERKTSSSSNEGDTTIPRIEGSTTQENFVEDNYDYYQDQEQQDYGQETGYAQSSEWNNDPYYTQEGPTYNDQGFYTGKKQGRYIYPGNYDFEKSSDELGRGFLPVKSTARDFRSLLKSLISRAFADHPDPESEARGLSDVLISVLGLNVPPGLGPLMLGVRGASPVVIVISRIIGTFMKVGKKVLDAIEATSILACTKNYLLVKMFRWIDS